MKRHAVKTYGGEETQINILLTSIQDACERSASCPGLFTLGSSQQLGGCLHGTQGWFGRCGEKKNTLPLPKSNPDSSICRVSSKFITARDVVLKVKMPLLSGMQFIIEINGH
jgi:hypothetical protein